MTIRQKTITYAIGNTADCQQQATTVQTCTAALSFVDETADAADVGTADVALLGASGDFLYIGSDRKFCGYWFDVTTAPVGGTAVWEFWNGSTWTALPTITYLTGNVNTTADTAAHWDDTAATGWVTNAVNSITRYWIRRRNTGAYSTAGTAAVITIADWHNLASGAEGGTRTVDLPETVSRTFRSVCLRIVFHTPILGGMDIARCRIKVGAGTLTDLEADNTTGLVAFAESTTMILKFDATALFTAGYTSTSHAIEVAFASLFRNVNVTAGENYCHYSAALDITYDFDDDPAQNATQINTVIIPFDSLTTALGTTITTIGGTGGMPIITGASGWIKEVTAPTIKELAIVYLMNTQEAGTTNWQFISQIDSESELVRVNYNAVNQSDFYDEIIWRRTDLTTTSAHDIKARVSSATGSAPAHVGGYIIVTYTYAASGVTVENFSALLPYLHNAHFFGGATAALQAVSEVKFYVPPAATLQQSGIVHYSHQSADPGSLLVALGGQTARSYAATPDVTSGPVPTVQRFDSGGAAGSGITFVEGWNTLSIATYVDTVMTNGGGEGGFVVLNYYYTKVAGKRVSHSRHLIRPFSFGNNARLLFTGVDIPIPEANYYISNVGLTSDEFSGETVRARYVRVSRGSSAGWYSGAIALIGGIDNNFGARIMMEDWTRFYKRYPTDPDTARLDIETARDFLSEGGNTRFSHELYLMYHTFTSTVSGTITDYTGDGSGITVGIWSKSLGVKLGSVVTAVGGGYTFTWYDDTADDLFAEAQQDATHVGRSIDFNGT